MKTIREIQEELLKVAPDLWPDVDEVCNDIRRDVAVELQALTQLHAEELAAQSDATKAATDSANQRFSELGELHKKDLDEAKATIADAESARDAARAELTQTRAFAAQVIGAANAALSDDKLSEEERAAMLVQIVAQAEKPAKQRALEALQAVAAKAQADFEEAQKALLPEAERGAEEAV